MHKKITAFVAVLLLLSIIITPLSAFAEDNAGTYPGSPTGSWAATYFSSQYMWKVSLFVAKDSSVTNETVTAGNFYDSFYRIGSDALYLMPEVKANGTPWVANTAPNVPIYYAKSNKVDVIQELAQKGGDMNALNPLSIYTQSGINITTMPNLPYVPNVSDGNVNEDGVFDPNYTGKLAEVVPYFNKPDTINRILNFYAGKQGTTREGLIQNLSFTINGTTKTGWNPQAILPNSINDAPINKVEWLIVYEPVGITYTRDRTHAYAFTATDYALTQIKKQIDWRYDETMWGAWTGNQPDAWASNANRQHVARFTHLMVPNAVLITNGWYGFASGSPVDDNQAIPNSRWTSPNQLLYGGWGMSRWHTPKITATPKDYEFRPNTDVIIECPIFTNKDMTPSTPINVTYTINGETFTDSTISPKGVESISYFKWHTPSVTAVTTYDCTITLPDYPNVTVNSGNQSATFKVTVRPLEEVTPPDPKVDDVKPTDLPASIVPPQPFEQTPEVVTWVKPAIKTLVETSIPPYVKGENDRVVLDITTNASTETMDFVNVETGDIKQMSDQVLGDGILTGYSKDVANDTITWRLEFNPANIGINNYTITPQNKTMGAGDKKDFSATILNLNLNPDINSLSITPDKPTYSVFEETTLTITTNKDVHQLLINSSKGDYTLRPLIHNVNKDQATAVNQKIDLNGDLVVDQLDIDIMTSHLIGTCSTTNVPCINCNAQDLTGDGKITSADLAVIQSHIDGNCALDGCYFHGDQVIRTETATEYIWTVRFLPTKIGSDIVTITPQSLLYDGVKNGESMAKTVDATKKAVVTFDSQGGTAVASKTTDYNTTITAPTPPTKTGYTFSGWYKESACTTPFVFATDKVVDSQILYAKWTIKSFTVSFNSLGGSAVLSKVTNYDTTITAPTAPTRTGYTFSGWFKESACTTSWTFATDKVLASTILYAKWTPIGYSVTFDSQGGSAVTPQTISYGAKATTPTVPTRAGYTFSGWFKESACTTAWTFASDTVIADTTIFAKWTPTSYTVTFDALGGSAVTAQAVNYNAKATTPTPPTKSGYLFAGWFKESACTNSWTFTSDVVTGNTILFAKWTVNAFTFSFDSQGGSAVTAQAVNANAKATTPTNPTRTGYAFSGWFKESTCTTAWTFASDTVTANTTVFAKWTPISYSVTFDTLGGSAITAQAVNYNAKATTPTPPTKSGYNFAGWFTESACTNSWTFTSDVVTGNTILYAKWTVGSFTVSFDPQGGSAVASQSVSTNSTATTPTAPTRTGYTFSGWFKESACTTSWTFASDTVTANTILFAKWSPIGYTMTFNSQGGSAVTAQAVNYGAKATAPTIPKRTGYTFSGWFKEAGCTTSWTFASDTITGNTTVFAKWTPISYTVTFNSQSGSAVTAQAVNYNTYATTPTAPTRTGYTFSGWFKESACTNSWTFASDKVLANTTIYAKWTPISYTVTFNSVGGTAVASQPVNYNAKATIPTAPTKAGGYVLAGWYKDVGCTDDFVFASDVITGNTTLYAKWEGQALINIFPNAGFAEDIRVNMNTRRGTPINTVNEKVVLRVDLDGVTSLVSPNASAITGVSKLPNLTYLNISDGVKVTIMPAEIGLNAKLESLYANNDSIAILPTAIGNLKALKVMQINANKLTSLPTSMGGMTALWHLNVGGNLLTSLPSELGNATGITALNATDNQIATIPDNFSKLVGLTECNFADNKLADISAFYARMRNYGLGWNFNRQIVIVDVTYRFNMAHTDIGDPNMNTPEVLRDMYQSYQNFDYAYQIAHGVPTQFYVGTSFFNKNTNAIWENGTVLNAPSTFNQQRLIPTELGLSGTTTIETNAQWFTDSRFIFNYTPSVDYAYDSDGVERVYEYEPGQDDSGNFVLAVRGFTGVTSFPTWSEINQQDDVVWYATYNGINYGTDSSRHNHPALYQVHVYNNAIGLGTKQINVNQAMHDGFNVTQGANMKFSVKNPRAFGGLNNNEVTTALWNTANGQDDLCWFTMSAQSTGNFVGSHPYVHGGIDHRQGGSYTAHLYVLSPRGIGGNSAPFGKIVGNLSFY